MNKLLIILGGVVAGAILLVGGIVLGDALTDDAPPAAAEAATPSSRQIPAATPVPTDSALDPATAVGTDPDAPTPPPTWPAPSPLQLVDLVEAGTGSIAPAGLTADDLAAIYDPETGIDSDATGEPWIPPTSPAFDPDTDEVDPEAPAVREDGVDEVADEVVADLFGSYPGLDLLLFHFVDACAGETTGGAADEGAGSDSECPDGVGGTIQLMGDGEAPDPLAIMRQMYTRIGVPLELRCEALGFSADGLHRAIFPTNNPADFTIRYWLSTEPDDVHTMEWSTPESERDRWLERKLAGERTDANMHTGVHNCPPIPNLFPGRHVTFEIHGVDDAGTESDAKIYFTTGTEVAGNASVGRPHASFVPLDLEAGRGFLMVPYNERTEHVYIASLPRAGVGATTESCTDVENAVLSRTRRLDGSLYNWDTTRFPRSEGDGYEPGIETSVITNFAGEEGTTYDLCIWVTKPPTRSFDKPPVVMREVFTVRTPLRWRTRILLAGGHSDVDLDARAVTARPTNWPAPWRATWPPAPVRSGAFMLDEMVLLHEGGSSPIPGSTILEVTGPSGATSQVALPTPTRCSYFFCDLGGLRQFDVAIPGPRTSSGLCGSGAGGCAPPTTEDAVGNLRLVVETYAGPGGPPTPNRPGRDSWLISQDTSFPAAGADRLPAIPRIDLNSVVLEPTGGRGPIGEGRPGLHVALNFDRPVQVTAVPQVAMGAPCPVPVAAQTTTELTQRIDMRFEGLCWGSTYGVDLVATDRDGNVLDTRTVIDGVPVSRGTWAIVEMPRVPVVEYRMRATFDQIGTGYGATSARIGPWELLPSGAPRCLADGEPREITIRNASGRPVTFADPMEWRLEMRAAGDGRDCGARSHAEWTGIEGRVPLDQLVAEGSATVHFTDDAGTDITLVIDDVVWAE